MINKPDISGDGDKLVEFICQLYNINYRPAPSLKAKVREVLILIRRATSDDVYVPRVVRQAEELHRRISASFPLRDEEPLKPAEEIQFKDILNKFALKIVETIGENRNDPYCLAICCIDFAKKWNRLVEIMDDRFLFGYGEVRKDQLSISTLDGKFMMDLFTKMRRAEELPTQLGCLHVKVNQLAITTSINAYFVNRQTLIRRMSSV